MKLSSIQKAAYKQSKSASVEYEVDSPFALNLHTQWCRMVSEVVLPTQKPNCGITEAELLCNLHVKVWDDTVLCVAD